jgi:hypothetical protein
VNARGYLASLGLGSTDLRSDLIDELSRRYDGKPFQEGHPDNVRVVCRLTPAKVYAQ